MFLKYAVLLLVISGVTTLQADTTDEDMVITPKGYGSFEIGQIGRGYYRGGSDQFNNKISHVWQQRALGNVGLTAQYKDFLEIDVVGEGLMAFSNPQRAKYPTTMQPRNFYYIKSSNICLSLVDKESFAGALQIGYFPYKYNPDVRNLGEYLFRSQPYPLVIYSDFDYPLARLLGLRVNANMSDSLLVNDLLLHSETVAHPVQNWSISDIASLNFKNGISVGGGLSLFHLNALSAYHGENIPGSVNQYYYPDNLSAEERREIDTTIQYSATKLMGRFAINGKQILEYYSNTAIDLFGKNDLKLYGELLICGLKNYPQYYEDINDRMIWTFGINFPGFNVIDIINLELEHCKNGTAFSDASFYSDIPSLKPDSLGVDPASPDGALLKRSPWRYSIYIKKSLFNDHFGLIFQLARDHKKISFYEFDKAYMSYRETLVTNKDWWWAFKTEYKF